MNINQASKETGISKDMIRFYEKKGLLKPKRDNTNNYRQYDTHDIHILITIKFYSSLGIPISTVYKIMRDGDITLATNTLSNQLDILEEEAFWARAKYILAKDTNHILDQYKNGIEYDIGTHPKQYFYPTANTILRKIVTSRLVFRIQSHHKNNANYPQDTGLLLIEQSRLLQIPNEEIPAYQYIRFIQEVDTRKQIQIDEIHQLEERIKQLGYTTYGDIYIYSIFHNLSNTNIETICIEFMIH